MTTNLLQNSKTKSMPFSKE